MVEEAGTELLNHVVKFSNKKKSTSIATDKIIADILAKHVQTRSNHEQTLEHLKWSSILKITSIGFFLMFTVTKVKETQ